jgi:hypothetical protein
LILGFNNKFGGCGRQITVAGGEQLITPLNKEKAENSRDSLAMLLYSKLFDWYAICTLLTFHKHNAHARTHALTATRHTLARTMAHA